MGRDSRRPPAGAFFAWGLLVAGLEEFLTQGLLKDRWFSWVFTLVPFVVFLAAAWAVQGPLRRRLDECRAAAWYYVAAGACGLALEWFVIGLPTPWSDRTSPRLLVALFHAGVYSFWGGVAFIPWVLLDRRGETADVRRRLARGFGVLMAAAYVSAFATRLGGANAGLRFAAVIGPVTLVFLALNVFYWQYLRRLGGGEPRS